MKVLFRVQLSQLLPGLSTESQAKAWGRKDLRRGPEYQKHLEIQRGKGVFGSGEVSCFQILRSSHMTQKITLQAWS